MQNQHFSSQKAVFNPASRQFWDVEGLKITGKFGIILQNRGIQRHFGEWQSEQSEAV
jgi:hypothetical protein